MNTKQCEGCYYWRSAGYNHTGAQMCCHYLLWEHKRREHHIDTCLSRREGKGRGPKEWPLHILDGSMHDGYADKKRRR